jgi:hypothetical protein
MAKQSDPQGGDMRGKKTGDMNTGRSKEFQRSDSLEALLAEVNDAIAPILPPPYARPRYPVVFVMGAPRSGTTLTTQWLAGLGRFAYPTNLSARFFANPYMGARIQQILADHDAGNQIGLQRKTDFSSALGKTDGALAPSEFWYFWRRFFSFGDIQVMSQQALQTADDDGFVRGIAGLEAAFDKPAMLKGMIMNWHVPLLDQLFDKVLFLNLERDAYFNAQSLYFARERFFGDLSRWYSFKPPEYEFLRHESVERQLAGQVVFTRSALRKGLAGVAEERKLTICYEDFCTDPAAVYSQIRERLAAQGHDLPADYAGESGFDGTNAVKLAPGQENAIRRGLEDYEKQAG